MPTVCSMLVAICSDKKGQSFNGFAQLVDIIQECFNGRDYKILGTLSQIFTELNNIQNTDIREKEIKRINAALAKYNENKNNIQFTTNSLIIDTRLPNIIKQIADEINKAKKEGKYEPKTLYAPGPSSSYIQPSGNYAPPQPREEAKTTQMPQPGNADKTLQKENERLKAENERLKAENERLKAELMAKEEKARLQEENARLQEALRKKEAELSLKNAKTKSKCCEIF